MASIWQKVNFLYKSLTELLPMTAFITGIQGCRSEGLHFLYGVTALLHQPLGGGGGTADAYRLDVLQPLAPYLLRAFYQMGVGVDTQTLVEEHLAITTLASADEEDQVVTGGKLRDIRHAVGDGATDGVETLEGGLRGDMHLDVVDDTVELIERLRRLAVQTNILREVK